MVDHHVVCTCQLPAEGLPLAKMAEDGVGWEAGTRQKEQEEEEETDVNVDWDSDGACMAAALPPTLSSCDPQKT